MDSLTVRLSVFCLSLICYTSVSILAERDWRNKASTSVVERMFKFFMYSGCSVPGLRLMCSPDGKPFPLADLSLWDTVIGCFSYSLAFITFLWFMTPFPDVKVFFFWVTEFSPRSNENQQPQQLQLPPWHPAGGEGFGPHVPL